jgi:hypothetical protein
VELTLAMTLAARQAAAAIPSHAILDAARAEGDPLADACVARLGRDVWTVNRVLCSVRRNSDPLPSELPEELRQLLLTHAALPAWLNRARVLRAQHWAERHLLPITVALFCAALPSAYAAERGARVLFATRRMQTDLDRRVNETARFVLELLRPGSFETQGAALPIIRKVRLIHAAVRSSLHERSDLAGEVPVNQEDLLGTLLSFSVVVLRALRRLGVELHAGDADDFYHLWRGVGVMLGVREDLLPRDFAAAQAAADRIAGRQFRPSVHGKALMAELLRRIEAHVAVPALGAAPALLVRHLVGDKTADLLGLPAASAPSSLFLYSSRLSRFAPRLGRPLLEGLVSAKLGGADAGFQMPADPVPHC